MHDHEHLLAQAERIRASGVLGRSAQVQRLFDFLVDCAASGRVPKETEIAVDAFSRGVGFDVALDSVVRVYMHKLRHRLDEFYLHAGREESHRIVLPKGEYRLSVKPKQTMTVQPAGSLGSASVCQWWLFGTLAISVVLNALLFVASAPAGSNPLLQVTSHLQPNHLGKYVATAVSR
jgi:hypothetical protein